MSYLIQSVGPIVSKRGYNFSPGQSASTIPIYCLLFAFWQTHFFTVSSITFLNLTNISFLMAKLELVYIQLKARHI